jgi:hypothetical protein
MAFCLSLFLGINKRLFIIIIKTMSELFNFIEDMANPTLKRENLKE